MLKQLIRAPNDYARQGLTLGKEAAARVRGSFTIQPAKKMLIQQGKLWKKLGHKKTNATQSGRHLFFI